MISNFKQVLVFYFISFANFLPNGQLFVQAGGGVQPYVSNKLEYKSLCYDFEKTLDTMTKTVGALQRYTKSIISEIDKLKMLRDNIYESRVQLEAKRKSLSNILEVKCANDRLPSNCYEIDECNNHLYRVTIANFSESSFPVSCDFKTEKAAWTVIQRRQDGSVNFYRNWTEYVHGFGDLDGEFFIGLEKLHALTTMGAKQQLYVVLGDTNGVRRYAKYNSFQVDSEAMDYKLTVGNYSGNAGDGLSMHSGYKFSTWDRDNEYQCARTRHGAWWYGNCYRYRFSNRTNLNGKYMKGNILLGQHAIFWGEFAGIKFPLKFTQMMISPSKN